MIQLVCVTESQSKPETAIERMGQSKDQTKVTIVMSGWDRIGKKYIYNGAKTTTAHYIPWWENAISWPKHEAVTQNLAVMLVLCVVSVTFHVMLIRLDSCL